MKNQSIFFCLILVPFLFTSCKEETPVPPDGRVVMHFNHVIYGSPLELDTMKYASQAGVPFKVTDLQYFVSKVTLYRNGGESQVLADSDSIQYVDARIPGTFLWMTEGNVPSGPVDSVAFTFGLDDQQNISNRFPNPPERDMFWPEMIGGGYHHMKLNSVRRITDGDTPFMMHLGTGQIYSSPSPNPDSIISFVPNWFRVVLPASACVVPEGDTLVLVLTMHMDHWFNGPPNLLDLNTVPPGIMQNQPMMEMIRENGRGAFTMSNEQ